MSKKFRRSGQPGVQWLPVKDLHDPTETYDSAKQAVAARMRLNLARTGHPLHHETADGTIVEPDPTLEEFLSYVSPDERPAVPAPLPGALPAVPVIRDWHETESGRTWLAQWIDRLADHRECDA